MSLKFLTIKGTNFCTLLDLPLFALCGRGMTLILGDNQDTSEADSNGAGKSLLLELFVWVLWGATIRGLKADEVVNDTVQKNCFGEVVFSVEGHTYSVRRYRSHSVDRKDKTANQKENDLVLLRDGHPFATEGKMSLTQDSINQLLGITFPVFEAMMPGTGIKAAAMGDTGIKELLEAILQTQVFAAAEKITKERLKKAKSTLASNEQFRDTTDAAIEKLEEDISWSEDLLAKFTENRQRRIDAATEESTKLNESIAQLDQQLTALTTQRDALPTEDQWQEKVLLKEKLQGELEKHHSSVQVMLDEKSKEHTRLLLERENLELAKKNLLGLGPSCVTCLQDIHDSHRDSQVLSVDSQLASVAPQIASSLQQQSKIQKASASVVLNFTEKLDGIKEEADQARNGYRERGSLNTQISAVTADRKAKSELIPALLLAANEGNEESEQTETRLGELRDLQAAHEVDLKHSKISVEHNIKEVKALEFWLSGYSTAGIRSHVLKSVTPVLNEITRKNCETLTGSEMSIKFSTQTTLASGEVREKFDIQVSQAHGGNSYKKNSDGEKQRADIVIALSLSDLAAMRTSFPFRFLDEPFVKVDESGVNAIIQLLRQYETQYDTIFVVTHQEHVKSIFSAPLTMVKSGGVSRLEGDTVNARITAD